MTPAVRPRDDRPRLSSSGGERDTPRRQDREPATSGEPLGEQFGATVGRKAARHIRARDRSDSVWFWMGMLGLIGWSVALPTVLGVALGLWLDRVAKAPFSWVVSLLVVGLVVGIFNAWFWVRRSADQERPGGEGPQAPPDEVDEE